MNPLFRLWHRPIGSAEWYSVRVYTSKADALYSLATACNELALTGLVCVSTTRPGRQETSSLRCVASGRLLGFQGDPRDRQCERV
jgi:hypothetical protein